MSAINKLKSATAAIAGLTVEIDNEHLGKIKVKAAISCAKAGEIQATRDTDGQMKAICLEVIHRCTDENDKPLFTKNDIITMMAEIDSEILTGLFLEIKGAIFEGKSTPATSSITG